MAITQDVSRRAGAAEPAVAGESPRNASDDAPPTGELPLPPAPIAASTPEPADYPSRRGVLPGAIVATVVAGALAMAMFIWYRWQAVDEPTTAVIVEGDATLDGAVVTVTGPEVFTARLSASKKYVAHVWLVPGRYMVTAEHGGRLLVRREVEVKPLLGVRIKLADAARAPPSGQARTAPAVPSGSTRP